MAPQTTKTPRKQHSAWLMLGGAMFVSVLGWAGIVRQTEGTPSDAAPAAQIAVVELPAAAADRGAVAQAPAQPSPNNQTTTTLRRVTRPVMRSRSSN